MPEKTAVARIYGVKLIVNGKPGWAKCPNGTKGFPTFEQAKEYADQLSRSLDLPAYAQARDPA